MNPLLDLMAEHCPDGVVFETLGAVATVGTGERPTNEALKAGGHCAYLNGGITPTGFVASSNTDGNTIAIPSRGSVGVVGYSSAPFWCGPLCYRVSSNSSGLLNRFLYYALKSKERQIVGLQQTGSIPALNKKELVTVRVPFPPLEVQREIVRILDTFTELEAELEVELEAELEARRKQYEHYRRQLMNFSTDAATRWVTLGTVTNNLDSRRKPVTRASRVPGPFPYYGANGVQDSVADYIFDGTFLLVGEDGSVTQSDGTPVVNWATGQIWVNNHAHVLQQKDDSLKLRFLYHYLQTVNIKELVTGSAQPKLNQGNLNKIMVPVLQPDRQDEIVRVLDAMSCLVHDLSGGLRAEIAARRQQYEYYRDRLLTFKEKAS